MLVSFICVTPMLKNPTFKSKLFETVKKTFSRYNSQIQCNCKSLKLPSLSILKTKRNSINIHSFNGIFNLIYEQLKGSSDKYFCSYIKDLFGISTKCKNRHCGVAVIVTSFRISWVHTVGIHTCTCAQGPHSESWSSVDSAFYLPGKQFEQTWHFCNIESKIAVRNKIAVPLGNRTHVLWNYGQVSYPSDY